MSEFFGNINKKGNRIDLELIEKEPFREGAEGSIYRFKKNPKWVLKRWRQELSEDYIGCLRRLEGKNLLDNMMKVIKVIDEKNVILEFIDGTPAWKYGFVPTSRKERERTKEIEIPKNDINTFIDLWCIGIFKAQYKLYELTNRYSGDLNKSDFIMRNGVPVMTDYNFDNKSKCCGDEVSVIEWALDTFLDENSVKIRKYLGELQNLELNQINIKKIIEEFEKFKMK